MRRSRFVAHWWTSTRLPNNASARDGGAAAGIRRVNRAAWHCSARALVELARRRFRPISAINDQREHAYIAVSRSENIRTLAAVREVKHGQVLSIVNVVGGTSLAGNGHPVAWSDRRFDRNIHLRRGRVHLADADDAAAAMARADQTAVGRRSTAMGTVAKLARAALRGASGPVAQPLRSR